MKKFSVIFVAVVFALSLAVPAMAVHVGSLDTGPTPAVDEGFSISGSFTIDGENYTNNLDVNRQAYDDDMEVVLKVNKGDVTAVVDMEISDDGTFDGTNKVRGTGVELIDNYYVTIDNVFVDGLKLKIGEYGVSTDRKLAFYSRGGHNIGIMYSLDQADLALYLGKETEGAGDPDDDIDLTTVQVALKGIDVLKKAKLTYANRQDDTGGTAGATFLGIDVAFDAGPIPIAIEYDTIGSDVSARDGGIVMFASAGLKELIGVDVNVNFYSSNDEFTDTDWDVYFFPTMIYGDKINEPLSNSGTTLIYANGSYKYSDDVTLKATVLFSGTTGAADESVGTEFDVHGVIKVASNTSLTITYGAFAPGDAFTAGTDDFNARILRARLKATF